MKKEKRGVKKIHLEKSIFILLMVVLISFLIYFVAKETVSFCVDGTFPGKCSETKPYICRNGILIEKAHICGCSEITEIYADRCISKYRTNGKQLTLKYILRGEENSFNFTVYQGLNDYLYSLPASIDYQIGETPSRADFKLRNINNEEQKELLFPLILAIQNLTENKNDRIRIAISIVQNIPFGSSNKTILFRDTVLNYSRYPYQVLYDNQGLCGEKSELLAFLLQEMGYEVVFFYHAFENHESIGINCPKRYSLDNSGYCMIETTGPSIMTDNEIEYVNVGRLYSQPEIIFISEGNSLGFGLYEYRDAITLKEIRKSMEEGKLTILQSNQLENLKNKYKLGEVYNP